MSGRTYVLTFREVPKSVNRHGGGAGTHWGAAHREKRRWEDMFLQELLVARVRRGMLSCAAEIVIRWKRPNHRDIENYRHPVVKPFADALVRGGYLPDDTEVQFQVADFRFEYPAEWPYAHPQMKADMTIQLTAVYAD